jgi:hypothetical protein
MLALTTTVGMTTSPSPKINGVGEPLIRDWEKIKSTIMPR